MPFKYANSNKKNTRSIFPPSLFSIFSRTESRPSAGDMAQAERMPILNKKILVSISNNIHIKAFPVLSWYWKLKEGKADIL
jgi:hypothetical protein